MNVARRRRIAFIVSCLAVVVLGVGFILYSLSENINLFFTPTQVVQGEVNLGQTIRIGGLVVEKSIVRGEGVQVRFSVTDTVSIVAVAYSGILPDLFAEGQAVVVRGHLDDHAQFVADEVLAKHDENYMPPEAAEAIMRAQQSKAKAL